MTISNTDNLKLIYVTCPTRTSALEICHKIVEERLAACGNIISGMTSIYRWQGKLEESQETILLLKTTPELVDRCSRRVGELHSYKVPCIVSWDMTCQNVAYSEWIQNALDKGM